MSSAIPNLGAIDPIGLIIDVGAGVLGLPPEVKNIAKIAVGIAMANPVTALNGATGLLGNLEERAATEWKPPPEGSPYATAGYAPSPSMESSGGLPGGANAANVQGYKVQGYIVQGYKENDGPSTPPSDDPASTPPECSGGTSSTGGDPKGRLLSRSDSLYYGAVEILWSEFTKAETGGYWKIPDGNLTLVDLGTLAADPNTPAHLRNAAAYFVDNPQEWGRLCAERGTLWHPITGMPTMNMAGLAAEMREGHQLGAIGPGTGVGGSGGTGGVGGGSGGVGGVGGGSGGTGGSGGVGGSGAAGNDGLDKVMNDPTLSAHEKAELILEQILGSLDTEMLDLLNKMRRVRKEQAGLKEDDKEKGAELASDMEMLQYRLQKVMERRTQMFTLLTNMQRLQHEASMAAVQNTR